MARFWISIIKRVSAKLVTLIKRRGYSVKNKCEFVSVHTDCGKCEWTLRAGINTRDVFQLMRLQLSVVMLRPQSAAAGGNRPKMLPGRNRVSSLCRWSRSCAVSVGPRPPPGRRWNWSSPSEKIWSTGTEPPGRRSGTRPRSWPEKREEKERGGGEGRKRCQKRRPRWRWWLKWGESDQPRSICSLNLFFPLKILNPVSQRQSWIQLWDLKSLWIRCIKIASITTHYICPSSVLWRGCSLCLWLRVLLCEGGCVVIFRWAIIAMEAN